MRFGNGMDGTFRIHSGGSSVSKTKNDGIFVASAWDLA